MKLTVWVLLFSAFFVSCITDEEFAPESTKLCVPEYAVINEQQVYNQYDRYEAVTIHSGNNLLHEISSVSGVRSQIETFDFIINANTRCVRLSEHVLTTDEILRNGQTMSQTQHFPVANFSFSSFEPLPAKDIHSYQLIGQNEGRLFYMNF